MEAVHGEVRQTLFDIMSEKGVCNPELFRRKYFKEEDEIEEKDLLSLFQDFIALKELTLKPKLAQKLNAILKHLKEFLGEKMVYPEEFNQLFVNRLTGFWRDKKGFQPNTIAKNFKFLRQFLNHLFNEELLKSSKYQRLQYPREVETNTVDLSKEEVVKLFSYIPENHSLERVKDLLLVLILIGLRFGDAIRINKSWVRDGFLFVNTQKTDERVNIPLHPKLDEVLKKHEYDLQTLKISNQKFNSYVKVLCDKAGINQLVEVVRY